MDENKTLTNVFEEREITRANGGPALLGIIFGMILSVAALVWGCIRVSAHPVQGALIIAATCVLIVVFSIMFAGLKVIAPNEAAVYTFFGKYYGTVKKPGFYYLNPFVKCYNPTAEAAIDKLLASVPAPDSKNSQNSTPQPKLTRKISTKVNTLNNRRQKVNDALGNPVIIGVAVIWKIDSPTKAAFNVENYNSYLSTQCDAVIRNNARLYPYDVMEEDPDEKTLRGSSQEIAANMKQELQAKVTDAGIEIKEVRITDLAYSDEIAAAMLQRQQATAIIAARQKIVEGAVSMVKMAIDQLSEDEVVVLDEERKAAMVSNLLVVLCGNKEAQPVVNSSSIY